MGVIHDFNRDLSLWINKNIAPNIDVVEGEDFCYYYHKQVVQYALLHNEKTDNNFLQFFDEYGLNYSAISPFVISLLHELGHAVTMSSFTEKEYEEDEQIKRNMVIPHSTIDSNYWYWELPIEFAANMWAINWANEHFNEVTELSALCDEYLSRIENDENVMEQLNDWLEEVAEGEYTPLYIYEEDCDNEC